MLNRVAGHNLLDEELFKVPNPGTAVDHIRGQPSELIHLALRLPIHCIRQCWERSVRPQTRFVLYQRIQGSVHGSQ